MKGAIEKLADREHPLGRRHIVCHRCSVECSVPRQIPLEDVACVGCLRRLGTRHAPEGSLPDALAALADWWDKTVAPGPGYGVVECPHCGASCVVEVGGAARTGCVVCLRPLGSLPLVRSDLVARGVGRVYESRHRLEDRHGVEDRMDLHDTMEELSRVPEVSCLIFPGEPL